MNGVRICRNSPIPIGPKQWKDISGRVNLEYPKANVIENIGVHILASLSHAEPNDEPKIEIVTLDTRSLHFAHIAAVYRSSTRYYRLLNQNVKRAGVSV